MMRPHGDYRMARFGRVVWVRVVGATNLEFARELTHEARELCRPILDQAWITVTDILDWDLCGPDVLPVYSDLVHWYERNNRAHSVNVVPPNDLATELLLALVKGVPRVSVRYVIGDVEAAVDLVKSLEPAFDARAMRRAIYDPPLEK